MQIHELTYNKILLFVRFDLCTKPKILRGQPQGIAPTDNVGAILYGCSDLIIQL